MARRATRSQSDGLVFGVIVVAIILLLDKKMNPTVTNNDYKGLVEVMKIPAEVHQLGPRRVASVGSVVPIHCATEEQVANLSATTHHYCDVFSNELLAPLGELAYVRLDQDMAEKVFINRTKRILLVSSDGVLAQWRCAPTFESANRYVAGAPIANKDGALVSVVTARRGNNYAVSTFEGEGGYFETPTPWKIIDMEEGKHYYGDKGFSSREELREYVADLPPPQVEEGVPPTPVLLRGRAPRLALVGQNGRQLSHHYLHGVLAIDVEYL